MISRLSRGPILSQGDADFEAAVRKSSFSSYDSGRRPSYLAQIACVDDVIDAVRFATEQGKKITICSGGHSWSQNHIRDDALLIDLSRLNSVDIDVGSRTAVIGPGCLSAQLDAALQKEGLFFPVAHAYTVGLGGFLLQGGFGWASQIVGLGCENVVGIDVVLGDGRLVHANEVENSDLLWAARGAGPGFFGVVVRFHLRLFDRPKFSGLKMQVFRLQHLEDVLTWAESIKDEISPKVEIMVVFNKRAFGIFSHGLEVVATVLADSRHEAKALLSALEKSPIRKKASFTTPLLGLSLQTIMKIGERFMFWRNRMWFADNAWLKRPIGPALPTIRSIAEQQPEAPSHIYWMFWNPQRTLPDMAFSLEGDSYIALFGALKTTNSSMEDHDWATNGGRALERFSSGIQLADENLARRPGKFMATENLARLQLLRKKFDPDERFSRYGHEA